MSELKIKNRGNTLEFFDQKKLEKYLARYTPEGTDIKPVIDQVTEVVSLSPDITSTQVQEELYSVVEGLISVQESFWQDVAGAIRADLYRREVFSNRGFRNDLKQMFELAAEHGQYTDFYKTYTDKEIKQLQAVIDYKNDYILNHVGAHLVYDRYVTSIPIRGNADANSKPKLQRIETLQERYMAISMFLHQNEKTERITKVIQGYLKMSSGSFTPATPTFMNSGRPNGNLSSCFIGMVEDSIEGIYHEARQFANISKNAGGYGLYFGKVRSVGASIRNKPGMSSGAVPFMKLFDVTASSVDQQG